MPSSNVNLQDSFLNHVRKENTPVEVTLLNGNVFRGAVRGFDNFTVMMHVEGKQHLVYKHAIAQLVTSKPYRSSRAPHGEKAPARKREMLKKKEGKQGEKFNALDLSSIKLEKSTAEDEPPPEKTTEAKKPPAVAPEETAPPSST